MADPDTNYIDNATISAMIFNGETVPDANTIAETPNLKIKTMVDRYINALLRITSNTTDTYGDLSIAALELYRQALDGVEMNLSDDMKTRLIRRYRNPPIAWHNPTDYERS